MRQAVLVGAPNCGKSSLFRLLTGKHVRVGNRAGVTVEALTARVAGSDWLLTDLPGLRAVAPQSEDERVTVGFLHANPPDLVLAVCDATCFAAQYPLLCEMNRALFPSVPTVLILNFCDELERIPSANALTVLSRVPFLPLSALFGRIPAAAWVRSLLTDGVLGGVGAILGFFPRLLLLFLMQTFLEQSGYLSRAARLFDPLFRRFGLRGDAVTPLLLGFGCSVPAVLCTRGMRDGCARRRCANYLLSGVHVFGFDRNACDCAGDRL